MHGSEGRGLARGLAAAGLVLALAGCGGGDSAEQADGGAAEGGEGAAGPLAEFFGYDENAGPEQFADQERRVQELIVACMAEEGFEYLPVSYPDMEEDPVFTAQQDLSPEEYARQYGYGMTTIDYEERAVEQEFEDPNSAIVEAMGEAEQEAYYRALYGEQPEIDPESTEEFVDYGFGGGCQGEASEQVYGGGVQEELGPKYEELYRRIEADPRIAEATRAWSACMSEAGYDFSSQQEPFEYISSKQNELYEEAFADQPAEPPSEGEEFVEPEVDEARLAALREEEIAIAVADQACQAEHLPPELRQEVSATYEREFIEENRELLEQARDAQNGG